VRLLVTRPRPDAERLAAVLEARGHEAVIEPLLRIEPISSVDIPQRPYQAVLLTSASAVRILAGDPALDRLRGLPVLAVGDATADEAAAAGFATVLSAGGAVGDLERLVRRELAPSGGPLLHVSGRVIAGDLAGMLAPDGYEIVRVVAYDALAAEELSQAVREDLAAGRIDGVLLLSPRTARTWANLVEAAGLVAAARRLFHYCLSQAVSEALAPLVDAGAPQVRIADTPDMASLLSLIDG